MNRLHALTRIQRAAATGDHVDGKSIFMALRFEIPNGGDNEVLSRKEIETFGDMQVSAVKGMNFALEKAKYVLDIAEGELRADLLDALDALDTTDPRDCRDLFRIHQGVGNGGGPASILEAIDALAAGGATPDEVAGYIARLHEIYPEEKPEADEAPKED